MSLKIGVVLSHPVQYYSPLFEYLSQSIELKVYYGYRPTAAEQGSAGFGLAFEWDIDLLKGYDHEFLKNESKSKYYNSFNGIDIPDIGKAFDRDKITHVLIIGWNYKFYIQALLAAKRRSLPVAVRGDSQLGMQKKAWINFLKRMTYPVFLRLYNKILYVGERNRSYLRYYNYPSRRLIFSPHAVDQQFWKRKSVDRNKEELEFLWVGKFIEKKRPEDVLNAFKDFSNQSLIKVKLTMIGTGPLLEKCRSQFQSCDNVHFEGFKNQQELISYYSKANCLILSSDYRETWGLVVNEAFSVGIPAIVSDSCGCSPDLINNTTGMTYTTGNVNELISCLADMTRQLEADVDAFRVGIESINNTYSFLSNLVAFREFLKTT